MTGVRALLGAHLFCAAGATLCFWTAALASKGQTTHRAAGFWFARLVYLTAITGGTLAVMSLAGWGTPPADAARGASEQQTMWLVLYVLLIIAAPVQHGIAAVAAAATPRAVRSAGHGALNVLSIAGSAALLPASLMWGRALFLVVVPIGAIVGWRNLRYAKRAGASRHEWEREHLTSLLTAGITLHTALLVFGTSRTLGWQLIGLASLWPWTVPALVGLPCIVWFRTRRPVSGLSRR